MWSLAVTDEVFTGWLMQTKGLKHVFIQPFTGQSAQTGKAEEIRALMKHPKKPWWQVTVFIVSLSPLFY